jgi:hypothetical protein
MEDPRSGEPLYRLPSRLAANGNSSLRNEIFWNSPSGATRISTSGWRHPPRRQGRLAEVYMARDARRIVAIKIAIENVSEAEVCCAMPPTSTEASRSISAWLLYGKIDARTAVALSP